MSDEKPDLKPKQFAAIGAYLKGGIHSVELPDKFITMPANSLKGLQVGDVLDAVPDDWSEPTDEEIELHYTQQDIDIAMHERWLFETGED